MHISTLLLSFCFSLLSLEAFAKSPEGCPAPQGLAEASANPQQIAAWLKTVGSKVKSPHQLLCCLPPKYKSQYVVGHSSLAGQNGNVEAPRIVAFDVRRDSRNIDTQSLMAVSISGGSHHNLQQKDSMEFMYLNPRTKQLEYFDLEFKEKGSAVLSRANPELCMNCHGQDGKTPAGGPRPIFDPFAEWNRFVGGRASFCSPTEEKYFRKVESMAVQSVRANPQLNCLDKTQLERESHSPLQYPKQFGNLALLDAALKGENRKRVLTLMKSYPSFKKYKLSLIGLASCGGGLRDWFPKETVEAMRATVLSKPDEINQQLEKQKSDGRKLETAMAQKLDRGAIEGDRPALMPAIAETQCLNKNQPFLGRSNLTSASQVTDHDDVALLMRYHKRNLMSGVDGDPVTRLLFETIGEDVSLWEMSPTGTGVMTPLLSQLPFLQDFAALEDRQTADLLARYFDIKPASTSMMPTSSGPQAFRGLLSMTLGLFDKPDRNSCAEFKSAVLANFKLVPATPSQPARRVNQ